MSILWDADLKRATGKDQIRAKVWASGGPL